MGHNSDRGPGWFGLILNLGQTVGDDCGEGELIPIRIPIQEGQSKCDGYCLPGMQDNPIPGDQSESGTVI